jgi:hypothetical protein
LLCPDPNPARFDSSRVSPVPQELELPAIPSFWQREGVEAKGSSEAEVEEMKSKIPFLALVLLSLGLWLSLGLAGDPQRGLDRAISAVEEALSSVQAIQATEDFQEAQDLAEDAEQDLREAISILEEIEIPNWLYLPEQGALYWHGPILDQETNQPVTADIFVNGHWVARAQEVQFLMWQTEEEPVWVRVEATGYKPWELRFRFRLHKLEVIEGPVWLVRQG